MVITKETLKVLRVKAGLSQVQLAEKVGNTSKTIGIYEADVNNLRKAEYDTIDDLAKALGVSVNDIFLG